MDENQYEDFLATAFGKVTMDGAKSPAKLAKRESDTVASESEKRTKGIGMKLLAKMGYKREIRTKGIGMKLLRKMGYEGGGRAGIVASMANLRLR